MWSLLQGSFAKETYDEKKPTNRSHRLCEIQHRLPQVQQMFDRIEKECAAVCCSVLQCVAVCCSIIVLIKILGSHVMH